MIQGLTEVPAKRPDKKRDMTGVDGSVLGFVSDEMYFLYHEAEQNFLERLGTYKALAKDFGFRLLLVDLEDIRDTVTNFFCNGLDMCADLMEMFIEKFQALEDSYEMLPA